MEERHQSAILGDNESTWMSTTMSLPVYLGDTVRERNAKLVALEEGQQMEAVDIVVPVSKMHTVSGAVVDARTGQALNAGSVALVYADDGKELASVRIDPETQTFTLPFVMEDDYKLVVKDAHEARFEQQRDPSDDPMHQNRKETVVRWYKDGEQPLIVQNDVSALNIPVTVRATKAQ